jgi:hypothetical protein
MSDVKPAHTFSLSMSVVKVTAEDQNPERPSTKPATTPNK